MGSGGKYLGLYMKLISVALLISSLAGCTVSVVDTRITREELADAFRQRDQALSVLFQTVKQLQEPKEVKQ